MASPPEPAPVTLDYKDGRTIAERTPSRICSTADAEEKRALHGLNGRADDGRNDKDDNDGDDTAGEPASDDQASRTPSPEFKEGGYGWVVVFAVFILNMHTWGMNSSYAVFLAYYLKSGHFPGASDIAFAFVGGLSISIAFLVSPLATASIGRYGTRITLLVGIFFETVAFVGASFTSQMWHLLLSQGVAFGIGMGFIFVGSVGIVPQWFTRRRSFANSLSTAGSGFGGLTYSLATNAMIKNIGLAWAFRVLAIVACAANLVSVLLVRDRNRSVGAVHVAFHWTLFRRPEYLLLLVWAWFIILGYVVVVFSLPAYAQAAGHVTAAQGSLVGALFNLSQGVGRPLIGLLSDPVGRLNVSALGTLGAGLAALFLWVFAGPHYAGLVVYSLLGGLAGILWATVAPVTAEIVGIPLLPSALSILWLVLALPSTFAEVIGLSLRTKGASPYLHVQLFCGLCYVGAFISAWLLRAWKLHQLDDLHLTQEQEAAEVRDGAAYAPSDAQRTSFGQYLLKGEWVFKVRRV